MIEEGKGMKVLHIYYNERERERERERLRGDGEQARIFYELRKLGHDKRKLTKQPKMFLSKPISPNLPRCT